MKNKFSGIFITFLFSLMYATHPFTVGEKLIYSAGFQLLSAGQATMELELDSLHGHPYLHITSTTKTNSILDVLYKVRDRIEVWIDPEYFFLRKVVKQIREGKYRKNYTALIDNQNLTVSSDNRTISIPDNVFDPTSIIYYLRSQELKIGKQFKFYTYDNGKLKEILVNITQKEKVNVPAGNFNCYVVSPISANNKKLLKNNGHMKIWYSDDPKKLPVKIEQKTNIGTMVLKLKKVILGLSE